MLLADQIKQARTPQEGFLLLAQAIDRLTARLDEEEALDPMGAPLDWGDMAAAQRDANAATSAVLEAKHSLEEIKLVRAALAEATDPDEIKVLNARLYLLKNPGTVPPANVVEGTRPAIDGDDVVFVPPTPERMEKRRNFARRLTLWDFMHAGWDEDTCVEAFAKGGPLWLYDGGARDAIMQMPYDARQWMCADIAKDSPALAQEVARDILKQSDSVDSGTAVAALEAMADAQH